MATFESIAADLSTTTLTAQQLLALDKIIRERHRTASRLDALAKSGTLKVGDKVRITGEVRPKRYAGMRGTIALISGTKAELRDITGLFGPPIPRMTVPVSLLEVVAG